MISSIIPTLPIFPILNVRRPLPPSPRHIVWLQTSFLGDIILTTAAMRLVREHFPNTKQHIVTTRLGVAALADFPYLQSRVAFDKSKAGLRQSFAAVKSELQAVIPAEEWASTVVLRAHRSFRSSLLATYLGAPSIAYEEGDLSWLASDRVARVAVLHEAQRIGLLLEPLGVKREEILAARPYLSSLPLQSDVSWQQALAALPTPWVGIAPGSVWGTKRWTIEGFCELALSLLQTSQASLVLLGSDKERPLTEAMMQAVTVKDPKLAHRCFNAAGLSDLDDLRRVIPQLKVLVSNDSSPIHYGSAFDIPTVAIFGATVPQMGFGPLAKHSVSLGVELECRPCSDHGPEICPLQHFRCMRTLSAKSVHQAVSKLLSAEHAVTGIS